MSKLKIMALGLAAASVIGGATVVGATTANAQSNSDTLVERIASKFNLNENDVSAVFDEYRDEKHQQMEARMSEALQQKVDDGVITTNQKAAIEDKLASLEQQRESERTALQTWADENGIDMKYLMSHGWHDSLDEAVTNGDLTTAQKDLITAKLDELKTQREARHNELQTWAEQQGLDLSQLNIFGRHGGFGYAGGRWM